MPTVLDLVTPVILRVDAEGDVQPADEASAVWLEAQEVAGMAGPVEAWDRSLLRLCGASEASALVGAEGPWRALALPGGETLQVVGVGSIAGPNVGVAKPLVLGSLALADGTNGGLASNYTLTAVQRWWM